MGVQNCRCFLEDVLATRYCKTCQHNCIARCVSKDVLQSVSSRPYLLDAFPFSYLCVFFTFFVAFHVLQGLVLFHFWGEGLRQLFIMVCGNSFDCSLCC